MEQEHILTIPQYISQYEGEIQRRLETLHTLITSLVPQATEKISWGMPTYQLDGNLIHFAVHKNHIGLYPGPEAIVHFKKELEGYKTTKGAIQLPYSSPLPEELVTIMVHYLVENRVENNPETL